MCNGFALSFTGLRLSPVRGLTLISGSGVLHFTYELMFDIFGDLLFLFPEIFSHILYKKEKLIPDIEFCLDFFLF
jgi:hypothetical protein